jgi:ATP-dependent Clp protease ATP-binding subunit ClpC
MEKHNVSRLIGAPPGYVGYEEGGQLTERIRRRPYSVVLLDEIEKAHPDVFNMLLQIMEEGRLTDSFGRHVDFRNVIMIMTSNIGSELIKGGGPSMVLSNFGRKTTGQQEERNYQQIKDTVMKELERFMRPEFIGRLDDVIVFRPLNRSHLENIVELELKKVTKRLVEHGLKIEISNEAKEFLIEKGTNADFGARPLRRAIEQHVEDPLSEDILRGAFKGKDVIKISVRENDEKVKHLYFETTSSDDAKPDSEKGELAKAASDAT